MGWMVAEKAQGLACTHLGRWRTLIQYDDMEGAALRVLSDNDVER
jgi:hypothetical protein